MAEIKFSPAAIKDLQQTKAYITEELCNEQAAVGTVAKITKRIIQRFIESKIRQHIVRVLYGRRNFMQILFGEPGDH